MSAYNNSWFGSRRMPSAAAEEEGEEGIFKKDNIMSGDAPPKDDYWLQPQYNYTLSQLPPPPQEELVSMPPPVMDVNPIQECSSSTAKDDYWLLQPQYNNYMLPPPQEECLTWMPPPVVDVNPTQECSSSTTANRFRPTDEKIIDYQFQQEQYGGHGFNGNPFIAAPQQKHHIDTYDYETGHQLNSTGEYQTCFRSMVSDTTPVLPNIPDDYPAAEQDLVMVSMPPEEEGILVINDDDVVVHPPAIGVVPNNDPHEDVNGVANVQEQVLMGDYNRPSNSHRFRPMDSELIADLRDEYNGGVAGNKSIRHLDIYAYEPHQLRAFSEDHGDGKMYFFTRVKKCGKNYTDRRIKSRRGCNWKLTQAPQPIIDGSKKIIGYKRPLKYCVEKKNTSWSMYEYTLAAAANSSHHSTKEELVVAVIYELHRNRR